MLILIINDCEVLIQHLNYGSLIDCDTKHKTFAWLLTARICGNRTS